MSKQAKHLLELQREFRVMDVELTKATIRGYHMTFADGYCTHATTIVLARQTARDTLLRMHIRQVKIDRLSTAY